LPQGSHCAVPDAGLGRVRHLDRTVQVIVQA
jgi:hypothetical protein